MTMDDATAIGLFVMMVVIVTITLVCLVFVCVRCCCSKKQEDDEYVDLRQQMLPIPKARRSVVPLYDDAVLLNLSVPPRKKKEDATEAAATEEEAIEDSGQEDDESHVEDDDDNPRWPCHLENLWNRALPSAQKYAPLPVSCGDADCDAGSLDSGGIGGNSVSNTAPAPQHTIIKMDDAKPSSLLQQLWDFVADS
jgi:hypothetical protein